MCYNAQKKAYIMPKKALGGSGMARTLSIGRQDFEKLIERNNFYVDKTNFIKERWENDDEVTLITRPSRFGKTLTMSMVEYFFR